MTKNIAIVLLSIAAAVMLYFLLHEPKPLDSHKDDYDRVVAQNKAFQEHEVDRLKVIDSLETSGKNKDSIIAALKTEQATTRKALDKTIATANRLAGEVKELRKGDTSAFATKCDSLAEQAQNFSYLYGVYKEFGDSLSVEMEQQKGDYTKALAEHRALYNELKATHDSLMDAYKILSDDYTKARKTIKRERLKTKIAAILGLIGGAAAVLK